MSNKLKIYFSLISGDIYYIEEDEIKNLDQTQIPLKQKPRSNCKQCFGRFHIGKHMNKVDGSWHGNYYIPCPKCKATCVDWKAMKSEDIEISAPRTTNELA